MFYLLFLYLLFQGNTIASFSRVPYEVVKQCLQTGQYSSTKEALVTMWKAGGLRSFFPLGGVSIQMVSTMLCNLRQFNFTTSSMT